MRSFDSFLAALEEKICLWLMAAMTVMVFVAVVLRYGFNHPLGWTDEAAKICFTWIVFLGGAIGVRRGAHIRIDILAKYLSPGPHRIVKAIADLSIGVLLFVLIYYGIRLSAMTSKTTTPSLDVSLVFIYGAAPVAASLMLYYHLRRMFAAYLSQGAGGSRSGEQEG